MANGQKTKGKTHEQYNLLAGRFDRLIDWNERLRISNFFIRLLREHNAKKILDMSTGTGPDSIALCKKGFEVVSLDGSLDMIERAKINAERYGVKLRTVVADWRTIGNVFCTQFEGAICLGNSFTHLEHREREEVVKQVRGLLVQNGVFIADYRNYSRLSRGLPIRLEDGGYYTGKGAEMKAELRDGLVVQSYIFDDGAKFTLSFKPVFIDEAIAEFESSGFVVRIFSDRRKGYKKNASFYQLEGKAN